MDYHINLKFIQNLYSYKKAYRNINIKQIDVKQCIFHNVNEINIIEIKKD